jgi:hypothetical protein
MYCIYFYNFDKEGFGGADIYILSLRFPKLHFYSSGHVIIIVSKLYAYLSVLCCVFQRVVDLTLSSQSEHR